MNAAGALRRLLSVSFTAAFQSGVKYLFTFANLLE
jgi:hypothetical protein